MGQGLYTPIIQSRKPLLIGTASEQKAYGSIEIPSPGSEKDLNETYLGVPILLGEEVKGVVSVQSHRQNAFDESDVRLLQTLANSMSVALENARLFAETNRHARESTALNEVGRDISSTLNLSTVMERIASHARELLKADTSAIFLPEAGGSSYRAIVAQGANAEEIKADTIQAGEGIIGALAQQGKAEFINDTNQDPRTIQIPGTPQQSEERLMVAPLLAGEKVSGMMAVWREESEPFSQPDLEFLEELSLQAAIAIKNANLFDETEQRNAELAIINSVQEGLASKLEMQAIYDLVGDRIRQVFDAQVVTINSFDPDQQQSILHYGIEKGERFYDDPYPLSQGHHRFISARQPLMIQDNWEKRMRELGYPVHIVPGTKTPKSTVFVPLIANNEVKGSVTLQNVDREHAFTESDVRLLQTLANSMSVALENARLFDEVQKRNREISEALEQQTATSDILRVIASSPTNIQPVLDTVAKNAAHLCDSDDCTIFRVKNETMILAAHHGMKDTSPIGTIYPLNRESIAGSAVLEKKILHIPDLEEVSEEFPLSKAVQLVHHAFLAVPLLRDAQIIGVIFIRRLEAQPFSESQIQLVKTFADQAVIAIENVRLFTETQRLLNETEARAAELAIINSVQQGLSSKLDMQAIYDLVGDKVQEIFKADTTFISTYHPVEDLVISRYYMERGQTDRHLHLAFDPFPMDRGLYSHVIKSRQPLLIGTAAEQKTYDPFQIPSPHSEKDLNESYLGVPLMLGAEPKGIIGIQSHRQNAFNESDVRLLQTLANSMSVALENARLFDETQRLLKETEQRASELATVNTISNALAGELDLNALIDLIGEQIRNAFSADVVYVALLDEETNVINFPYEHGQHLEPLPLGEGLTSKIIEQREPLLINQDIDRRREQLGAAQLGAQARSYLGVPIFVGSKAIGVISVQSIEQENIFDENDQRLLGTIAANVGVAMQNARLFAEVQTRNREITEALEQQTATSEILRVIASSPTNVQPVMEVIATNAAKLSGSDDAMIDIKDKGMLRLAAHYGTIPMFPIGGGIPLNRESVAGRAMLEGHTLQAIHQSMTENSEYPEGDKWAQTYNYKMTCSVPLLREGKAIGAITIRRLKPNLLTEKEISLIETFASQAVIAIENVRLFTETQRLLKETEQHAAELAILNSVGDAMGQSLDVKTVTHIVGEKVRDIFKAEIVDINLLEPQTNLLRAHYN
jgi:GAF domain-containing protein